MYKTAQNIDYKNSDDGLALFNLTPHIEKSEPITVTKPSLPPLEEFIPYLEKTWKSQNLTNNGKYVNK